LKHVLTFDIMRVNPILPNILHFQCIVGSNLDTWHIRGSWVRMPMHVRDHSNAWPGLLVYLYKIVKKANRTFIEFILAKFRLRELKLRLRDCVMLT
ncbi:hypothetical protein L9F63_007762, partial [Diploptera punctata]